MKSILNKMLWFLNQFGVSPLKSIRSISGLLRYLRDLQHFKKTYSGHLEVKPCLHDRYKEGGATKSEYFWQDLLVAQWVFHAKPQRHVDIGSRVDGFVAHVASFREIEVFDVRPISTQVPGVLFKQADLMKPIDVHSSDDGGYCDSLSCLHALEHFGLGRYGDPIEPQGYELGIANMAHLLKPGGIFYLSIPIGKERVEFNAHRILDPRKIIQYATINSLNVQELSVVAGGGIVHKLSLTDKNLLQLAEARYNLGIFVFNKTLK